MTVPVAPAAESCLVLTQLTCRRCRTVWRAWLPSTADPNTQPCPSCRAQWARLKVLRRQGSRTPMAWLERSGG